MPRYVAFLRAINVGGSHVVKMEALRTIFEGLGFSSVETFIASGNVVFETRSKDPAALERKIEKALALSLGHEVTTFIRLPEDVARIARYQAFAREAEAGAVSVNVGLLKAPLPAPVRDAILRLRTDIDDLHVQGSEIYWLCVKGVGGSKIPSGLFERTLKTKATFRGRKTMEKLAAKYPA
jgi:uncharacterized protein (DUF1697 family)